jgi:hypothetical protein
MKLRAPQLQLRIFGSACAVAAAWMSLFALAACSGSESPNTQVSAAEPGKCTENGNSYSDHPPCPYKSSDKMDEPKR